MIKLIGQSHSKRMASLQLIILALTLGCSGPTSNKRGSVAVTYSENTDNAQPDQSSAAPSANASARPGVPPGDFSDPSNTLSLATLVPTYSGTSIVSFVQDTQKLPMKMNHLSLQADNAAFTSCSNCHTSLGSGGSFFPGFFHSTLANMKLPSPSACSDCHSATMPTGFVGPTATSPARMPPSGEMKHDAVVWKNDAPTASPVLAVDCASCHTSPTQNQNASWASGLAGAATPKFHASLAADQPSSCVDCHANSRPSAVLNASNAMLPAGVSFDHSAKEALADCVSCHSKTSSWTGGKQHLVGSTAPASCVTCHQGQRPKNTTGWLNTGYAASPFDYGTNAQNITHGNGLDCVTCHSNPGTGAWGVNQNWAAGKFIHGPKTSSATTCIACHSTQRPDLQAGSTAAAVATLLGFDHSLDGTGDCFGCHQNTVKANSYVNYFAPGTTTRPGGDWKGGVSYPGSTLISGMDQFITLTQLTLNRSAITQLVTSTTSTTTTLYNSMLHVSTVLPPGLAPGPSASPNTTTCWHCHTNVNGSVTSYANGQYHSSLTNFKAAVGGTVAALPQPTSRCAECHSNMQPDHIVRKAAQDIIPMDHDATFATPVTIGGVAVNGVSAMDCSSCHKTPGVNWTDGTFHANISGAVPADCVSCHYPLMANKPKADLTSGTLYAMAHGSTQLKTQNCATCHTDALANATMIPNETLWKLGNFHSSLSTQPNACVDCHAVSKPKANASTPSSWTYVLASGGTASNSAQWMNHGSAQLGSRDCVACHASDAKANGSAWNKAALFHSAVTSTATCQECHGLTNGGGTVAGINNNLPFGLTNSSTLTSASANSSTGVAAGTRDQINHADINVSSHDCSFCHTQAGKSTTAGFSGKEWAQAKFHASFGAAMPLLMNQTTGRCSSCHLNVKPSAAFSGYDHSSFTASSGSTDCVSCHAYPGTGSAAAPNWQGAKGGVPNFISVGGFAISQPPATTATTQKGISNLPHPTVAAATTCTTCHTSASGGKGAHAYDHASTSINANCNSCHEAGSNLIATAWNRATSQAAGAGDTRPYTLTSVVAKRGNSSLNVSYPKHFYPVDCYQCHSAPSGISTVTTGTGYTSAWKFPHSNSKMSNPSTCAMCHPNGNP